jgi:hypothetical protein
LSNNDSILLSDASKNVYEIMMKQTAYIIVSIFVEFNFLFLLFDFLSFLEVERNLLVGKLVVYISISLDSCLNISLVLGVKVYLKDTLSINLATSPLSFDLGRVDNIVEDSILNSSQGAATRADSLGLVGTSKGLSKDGTLSNDKNLLSREFLLELTNKTSLDLLERLVELVGNVKDDCLTSSRAVYLLCSSDVKITKGGLEVGGHLKVEKFLCDRSLKFIRLSLFL